MKQIKYFLFIVIIQSLNFNIQGQTDISLEACLQKARKNYPLYEELQMVQDQLDLRLKLLNSKYYPNFDLNMQASYQNDVPHIESEFITFELPVGPKDQYKASLDMQQVIFDAGRVKKAKEVENYSHKVEQSNLEVELFQVRGKVIQTYFLILTIQEQLKQLEYQQKILNARIKEMTSAVENGIILSSQLDKLKVEVLNLDQQRIGLVEGKSAAIKILERYIGEDLASDIVLTEQNEMVDISSLARPEYQLYEDQRLLLDMRQELNHKNRLPYLSGYGQLGYGNPTYNMLNDQFGIYYLIGIRLKWNVWDWKKSSHESQYLQIQQNKINQQQKFFDLNIQLAEENKNSDILKMQQMMEKDDEILKFRKSITKASESQMKNGSLTTTDYIADLHAESLAALAKKIHYLELLKAKIEKQELGVLDQ